MEQHQSGEKRYRGCMSDENISVGEIAKEIFDNWDYGHAFAYLWRRFGPPQRGGDSYKELVGYLLTSSMKGVLLYVSPKPSASTSFGYFVTRQISHKLRLEWMFYRWCIGKGKDAKRPRNDKIKATLKRAMEELKRPVNVRDWLLNIQGLSGDDRWDKKVEYSKYAGYGITEDYFLKFEKFAK